jgi:hypothetical protein
MRKYFSFFVFCLLIFAKMQAQTNSFHTVKLTTAQLPKIIHFKGKLIEAYKWNDKTGENILITSLVKPYKEKKMDKEMEEFPYSAELFAYQFRKKDNNYKLLWKISDGEKKCPFDITTEFIKGSTIITDLNKDSIAETTIQYKLACRSDVSPAQMKLIMHQDTVKYALRGTMWIKYAMPDSNAVFSITEKDVNLETLKGYKRKDDDYSKGYGRYETEKDFKNAPAGFLEFARKRWLKFAIEKFE